MLAALALCSAVIPGPEFVFDQMLVYGPFNSGGRTPCPIDPVVYQLIEDKFKSPKPGDTIGVPSFDKIKWSDAKANKDGWFEDPALGGGYAYGTYVSDKSRTMLLDASGHSMVYVNSVPRGGDPYAFGFVQLPVEIKKGSNEFLFSVGRGRVRASLKPLDEKVTIQIADPTFPDVVIGENEPLNCSVLLMNATHETFVGHIHSVVRGMKSKDSEVHITPMTVKKVSFCTPEISGKEPGQVSMQVELRDKQNGPPASTQEFKLDVKSPTGLHKRTFLSSVDGSVQYYAVQPANQPGAKALVMSLHGAGVEATSQAAAYGQKPWCNIICPTNGRPYGFDWEDWGRINALDALADAKNVFHPDPSQVYLTGHSMGGHGTWSIGLNNPDLFAAIAPCAGWISFWSYAGAADWKDPDPVEKLLRRAANPSDTLLLLDNAKNLGIYIQHGDKDDNVPVEQAREMRKRLAEFHKDFDWHEEPGQSHWFDTDPEAGANVQDYAPLFDFLAKHRIRSESEQRIGQLTTVDLDVASKVQNVTIGAQEHAAMPSQVQVRSYADGSYEEVTTKNVATLLIGDLLGRKEFKLKIDEQDLAIKNDDRFSGIIFKVSGRWKPAVTRDEDMPPVRFNWTTFKSVIGRTAVYGTGGSASDRAWAHNKARFDAETWWYRGNGSMDIVPDSAVHWGDRSNTPIVCYGNTSTNSVLNRTVTKGFGWLDAGEIELNKVHKGDFGFLWRCTPHVSSNNLQIAVIGGTTLKGCRAVERLPIFLSGVHYPDVFVNTPEMYLSGSKGVKATGFYGPDWSLENGEFAYRD